MGLFVTQTTNPAPVEAGLAAAYKAEPMSLPQAQQQAGREAPSLAQAAAAGTKEYHWERLGAGVLLFLVLLGVAVAAEAADWVDDATTLYGFAETVLGLVVGLFTGEATK